MTEKKYRELWYIRITDKTLSPFLYFLKTAPPEQIKEQCPKISQFDWPKDSFGVEWESFVANDHTRPYLENPGLKLFEIREVLQPIAYLLFPNWIMDRFKEALDQHVRGQWLSSVSLCGDIVEFIVNEFWATYVEMIPKNMRKMPKEVTKALGRLFELKILDDEDYKRLKCVRKNRDNHVHNYPRNFFLKGNYPVQLKAENAESLRLLSEFFTLSNMESKYKGYLDYAIREFFPPAAQ